MIFNNFRNFSGLKQNCRYWLNLSTEKVHCRQKIIICLLQYTLNAPPLPLRRPYSGIPRFCKEQRRNVIGQVFE